ncbi:MFS transporter [Diaminobutyricibacter tongyongensis]|uniref:MFS transporter n=1 Tax=Leifsonia tongyongensis TaxID=1268043 RepID=A0A6L9Y1Y5_9MICO|nr:MFS transporter [Diaminobutyricibacter tongyongensis]NEN07284.1 MFS transporter [Diaminobutyricibacter tongyongensis]
MTGSWRQSRPALIVALISCVLAFQLGVTMVTPVLDRIGNELGIPASAVGASQTLFFLAGGVSCLVCVRLSDRFGRKPLLFSIMIASTVGAFLIAFAPSVLTLMVGRTLQGWASAVFPLVYLLLRETLPGRRFGPAVGMVSAFGGGLFGVDGLIGGALGDRVGSRAVFMALAAFGALAVVASALIVPMVRPAPAIVARSGWRSAIADLRLLHGRSAWPFLLSTMCGIAGAFAVMTYLISLLSQDAMRGFGLDSTGTAIVFLVPAGLIALISAPIAGRLAPRFGWSRILRLGLAGSAAALAIVALFTSQLWIVFAATCLLGLSFNGTVLPMINGLSVLLTPAESPGLLPALNGVCVGVGASLGVALVAPLVASGSPGGYAGAFWLCCGLVVVALCAAFAVRLPDPLSAEVVPAMAVEA